MVCIVTKSPNEECVGAAQTENARTATNANIKQWHSDDGKCLYREMGDGKKVFDSLFAIKLNYYADSCSPMVVAVTAAAIFSFSVLSLSLRL